MENIFIFLTYEIKKELCRDSSVDIVNGPLVGRLSNRNSNFDRSNRFLSSLIYP